MRTKPRRYLLVKIVADKPVSRTDFNEALTSAAARFFGEVGLSRMNMRVLRYDEKDWTTAIAVGRESQDEARAVLALITEIKGQPAATLVLRSGGTLKSLKAKRRPSRLKS
jgi:RNase P/RNase MRP subunit POP5